MAGIHLLYIKKENFSIDDIYIEIKKILNIRDENVIVKLQKRNSGYYGDYYLLEFFNLSISIVNNLWSDDESDIPYDIVDGFQFVLEIEDDLDEIKKDEMYAISNRLKVLLEKNKFEVFLPEKQPSDFW